MKENNIKKRAMIEALTKTLGNVAAACKQLSIVRQTHYNWLESDQEYATSVANIQESAIDFVEGMLFTQIKEGNITAIIFYLKTIGKKRGYIEKVESSLEITAPENAKEWLDGKI
jgi:hypothetical protein